MQPASDSTVRWLQNQEIGSYLTAGYLAVSVTLTVYELRLLDYLDSLSTWTVVWLAVRIFLGLIRVATDAVDAAWRLPHAGARRPPKTPITNSLKQQEHKDRTDDRVDVIITACGESADIVTDTVRAACTSNFPPSRFRVLLADDGADPDLQRMVERFQSEYSNLYYYARKKEPSVPHKFKAGNINSTLKWTSSLPGGSFEWFAILDCDQIPEPDWLVKVYQTAAQDQQIGMAVPPQHFYNIPANDLLFQSTELQFEVDEILRNDFSSVWCSGSGFIARRTAVNGIGGFPDVSLSEDILCGLKLNATGWRVVLVDEKLQWGLMPETIASHVEQRRRWTVGSIQNAIHLRFCLDPRVTPKFTIIQRLQGLSYCLMPFTNPLFRTISFAVLPWVLISGDRRLLVSAGPMHLQSLLLLDFARRLLSLTLEHLTNTASYPHAGRQLASGTSWMATTLSTSIISELTASLWPQQRLTFISSGSMKSCMNERDASLRAPLKTRLRFILFDRRFVGNTLMIANLVFCLTLRAQMDSSGSWDRATFAEFVLLANSLSVTHGWDDFVYLAVPIFYALFPPTMPERRKMMETDEKTKRCRPKDEYKLVPWNRWALWLEVPMYASLLLTAAGVFASFGI